MLILAIKIGTTPLHVASKYGRMDLIQVLLKYGADVNKLDKLSCSPLYQAASGNHVQAVKLLLEHKAKISNGERFLNYRTILYDLAEGEYSAEVTTMLLERASTEEKNKVFLESCRIGKVELVSKLLSEYRVNPNLISIDGCATILQDICQFNKPNSVNIANLLLQAGAEQTLVVGKWPSALEIVQREKNKEFIELFAQYKNKTGSPVQHTNNHFQPTLGPEVQSAQPLITDNKNHHSPQKQFLGISSREWTMGLALLFGTVGATLVAIGIIPEITAIGIIATAVLLGIASAALGGVVGYLIDITVNNFHSEATMKVA
ncbi:UNVERIFIED_CONTAM: ankyrin repeat domain-containing protein [Wolbachia endosymbiont of Nasonia longicornis]